MQGPLTVFSIHYELGSPRDVTLANQEADVGFTLQGDSPVTMNKLDETAKVSFLFQNASAGCLRLLSPDGGSKWIFLVQTATPLRSK